MDRATAIVGQIGRLFGIDGLDAEENRVLVRWGVVFALAAMALRLFFWLYTHRLWEDALITTLHSENAWSGLGMTHYHPGEPPLHGFTSPLSVLIPLLGDAVYIGWGVEFLKLVSIFAGGLTVLFMLAIAIHPSVRLPGPLAVMLMGYVACEHHQILWGMAGMETQVVTLVLIMTLYYALAWKRTALGIMLGFCMLARPDFAFLTIIVGVYVLFKAPRSFPYIVLLACAVYGPWIIFTTLYYGSPLPNTILAKSMGYHLWWMTPSLGLSDVKREIWDRITGTYFFNTIFQPLGPSFGGHGTHFRAIVNDHGLISDVMTLFAGLGAVSALLKRQWNLFPVISFVGVYAAYYVFFVPYVFGWYIVPFVAATLILSAHGCSMLMAGNGFRRFRLGMLGGLVALYLMSFAVFLPKTFTAERRIQHYVEDQGRMALGLYLNQVMRPDETVGCEPLGYIGYYSRRIVYDWPGLANRKVVQFQREHPDQRTLYGMLRHIQPNFIVLRQHEYSQMPQDYRTWFDQTYRLDKEFFVSEEDKKKILLWHVSQDMSFRVFKRNTGA